MNPDALGILFKKKCESSAERFGEWGKRTPYVIPTEQSEWRDVTSCGNLKKKNKQERFLHCAALQSE